MWGLERYIRFFEVISDLLTANLIKQTTLFIGCLNALRAVFTLRCLSLRDVLTLRCRLSLNKVNYCCK